VTPKQYLAAQPKDRRIALEAVRATILDHLPAGYEEGRLRNAQSTSTSGYTSSRGPDRTSLDRLRYRDEETAGSGATAIGVLMRKHGLIALLAASALVLAACGSDGDDADVAAEDDTTTTTEAEHDSSDGHHAADADDVEGDDDAEAVDHTLEAAMFLLPQRFDLDNAPNDGGALMQYHIHNDLCFTTGDAPRVAGLRAANGTCSGGLQAFNPNIMVHVWIRENPCGPFAALNGIGGGQIAEDAERSCLQPPEGELGL
jgi:hypothetical protein